MGLTIVEFRTQTRFPSPVRTASAPLFANLVVEISISEVLVVLTDFTRQTAPPPTTTYGVGGPRSARKVALGYVAVREEALIFTNTNIQET